MSVKLGAVNPMKIYHLDKLSKYIEYWREQKKQLEILISSGIVYSPDMCNEFHSKGPSNSEKLEALTFYLRMLCKRYKTIKERCEAKQKDREDAVKLAQWDEANKKYAHEPLTVPEIPETSVINAQS